MRIFLLAFVVLVVGGCTEPLHRYSVSRLNDLTDVAHVDVTPRTGGLLVAVGPAMLGYEGIWRGPDVACRLSLGLGGPQMTELHGSAYGIGYPFRRYDFYSRAWGLPGCGGKRTYAGSYRTTSPPWGAVALHAGWPATVGFQADVVELADFFLGLFTLDIVGDDLAPPR
jgi:hypothetical protein